MHLQAFPNLRNLFRGFGKEPIFFRVYASHCFNDFDYLFAIRSNNLTVLCENVHKNTKNNILFYVINKLQKRSKRKTKTSKNHVHTL